MALSGATGKFGAVVNLARKIEGVSCRAFSVAAERVSDNGSTHSRSGGTWDPQPIKAHPSFYDNSVEQMASRPLDKRSVQSLIDEFGGKASETPAQREARLVGSARYVQQQLPLRLARRLMDLQLLPHVVISNPHIKTVYNAYYEAFNQLRRLPPVKNAADNERFTEKLKFLVDHFSPMVTELAHGVRECKKKTLVGDQLELDDFLDSMLRSRIVRRVMAEQHICLSENQMEGYIGVIAMNINVKESVQAAARKAQEVSYTTYGDAPNFAIDGTTAATLAYIPVHLDYILFELFKNAARATVELHQRKGNIPPVHVTICQGSEDELTIRIADRGGGIPQDVLENIWRYGFTTVADSSENDDMGGNPMSDFSNAFGSFGHFRGGEDSVAKTDNDNPMAGLGFGLPLSRMYARFFGGDLQLTVIPGFGTDTYLHLSSVKEQLKAIML